MTDIFEMFSRPAPIVCPTVRLWFEQRAMQNRRVMTTMMNEASSRSHWSVARDEVYFEPFENRILDYTSAQLQIYCSAWEQIRPKCGKVLLIAELGLMNMLLRIFGCCINLIAATGSNLDSPGCCCSSLLFINVRGENKHTGDRLHGKLILIGESRWWATVGAWASEGWQTADRVDISPSLINSMRS